MKKMLKVIEMCVEAGLATLFEHHTGEPWESGHYVQTCLYDFDRGRADILDDDHPRVELLFQPNYVRNDGDYRITVTCKNIEGIGDLSNFFDGCDFCNPIEIDWSGCSTVETMVTLDEADVIPAFEWVLKRKGHIRYERDASYQIKNVRVLSSRYVDF